MLGLLKDPNYIRYYLAVVISQIGDGVTRTVIIFLVARLTESSLLIGLAIFAQLAPTAILGIFTGALADRFSRKQLMVGADLFRMGIVLSMIPAQNSIPMLLILVAFLGVGTAIFEPARVASVPELVGRERIPQAVALFQGTIAAIQFLAPSIAGFLLAGVNISLVFIIDTFSYFCSGLLLYSLLILKHEKQQDSFSAAKYITMIKEGLIGVYKIPSLRSLLIFLMPIMFVNGVLLTSYKSLLLNTLMVSGRLFGLLEGAFGVGAIIGAVGGPILLRRLKPGMMVLASSTALSIGMMLILLLSPKLPIAFFFGWCLMIGCCYALVQFPLASLFLQSAPPNLAGRGISIFQASITIWTAGGVLLGGALSDSVGPIWTLTISGLSLLAACCCLSLFRIDEHLTVPVLTAKTD
ncbi:MFS transporter [Mesobacillus harenae]|uniref:MFS transporter n=1 Tax=Mesobacillus harenae TaxID=2213203 RepID=UPI001580F33B|nr:MFS transporter [Mesobacillus harenae]